MGLIAWFGSSGVVKFCGSVLRWLSAQLPLSRFCEGEVNVTRHNGMLIFSISGYFAPGPPLWYIRCVFSLYCFDHNICFQLAKFVMDVACAA